MSSNLGGILVLYSWLVPIFYVGICYPVDRPELDAYWRRVVASNESVDEERARFIGFLEGSLDVVVPAWWRTRLRYKSNGIGSGRPISPGPEESAERSKRTFDFEENELKTIVKFKSDGLVFDLGSRFVGYEKDLSIDCSRLEKDHIVAAKFIDNENLIVARFDKTSNTEWFQPIELRNKEELSGRTGVFLPHCLEIVRNGDKMMIFGARIGTSFVCTLDLDSGELLDISFFKQL
jgi:hypothetical protein